MSILSGFKKVRRRIRLPDGYKLLSFWTSSQTVEMDDGTTLESNKAKWDDASTKKHEHTNKPALDSITSEKVAKWNTLAESNVTGVKGNTESSYRTGNVNLTSANIGALPITGGTLTGSIYPATNNNSSVGTSSYKWANMYATTFHGALDGKANLVNIARVTKSASYNPGENKLVVEEFTDNSSNLPTSGHYYHVFSSQGSDTNYVTQLALGMTVDRIGYRNKKAGTWGNWVTLIHSGNVSSYAATPSYVQNYVSSKQPHTHVVTGASGYGRATNILNGQYLEGTVIIGTAVIYYAGVGYLIYPFNICIARNVGYNGYYLSRANNGNNIYEMQFKFDLATRNTSSSFYEEVKLVSESSSGYYCSGAQYTVIPPS